MNKGMHIFTARNVFYSTFLFAALVLAFLAPRAAVNIDEQLHYPHAKNVVNWYFTKGNDKTCLDTPVTNLKYYGQSVDNFTALFNRIFKVENEFLTRHYTGAFFYWLLILFTGLVAYQLSGNYWVSVIAALSLIFMPRLFGQAFGNLKDIPFATGYMAGILMIVSYLKEMPNPRWKTAVLLGISIAFTCSVRIGGLILFAYLGLFLIIYFVLKPFELKHIFSTKPCFVRLMGQGLVILLIGYFAGLLFWPYALQNVFVHPLESLNMMEHYKVSIRQVFDGKFIWSTHLPWYYLPKWILISTPEFIFPGFIIFLILFIKKIFTRVKEDSFQTSLKFFLIFTFFFPVIYVIAIKSNLYSGVRQMLFVFPVLAVLASYGMYSFYIQNRKKLTVKIIFITFFGLMILPLKHQATTFPADYIYFNSISGGNKKAWGNYEYDYYFHAFKEPAEFLARSLSKAENITIATNCNLTNYFEKNKNITSIYTRYPERSSVEWDYAIFGLNYIHPYLLKNNTWQSTEIIKTFFHNGNPVAVILKRKNMDNFAGIKKIEAGDYENGEIQLLKALEEDPQNVWLLVNLAKASLMQGKESEFQNYITSARKIYPDYEPLFLLEAQKFYNENNIEEAVKKLDLLTKVNPLYEPAIQFRNTIKEK
jgi:tetratricopeptide (TPR) repeat protein